MLFVYSCDEILERGLLAVGIVDPSTVCRDSNLDSFRRWEGSEAERLLRLDMDEGKHEAMAPRLLYAERREYREFPLHVFRGHIHQEKRTRKFLRQYCATRAKK